MTIRSSIQSAFARRQQEAPAHRPTSTRPRRSLSGKAIPPGFDRPARWHEIVLPGPAPVVQDPDLPRSRQQVTTHSALPAAVDGKRLTRRERRALERAGHLPRVRGDVIEREVPWLEDDEDIQYPLHARARTRDHRRKRARVQRKGQRVYVRDSLRDKYNADTKQAQHDVLAAGREVNPARFDNVLRALQAEYGEALVDEAVQGL